MDALKTILVHSLILAAIPAALSAQAAAAPRGMGYTMVMTTDSGGGRKTTFSIGAEVLGGKLRISMKSDAIVATPVDTYMIVDSVAGTLTSVIPAQSLAMVMARPMMSQIAAMPQPVGVEMESSPINTITDLGEGERILGFATHRFRQAMEYTLKITVDGQTCAKPSREVSEIWTTTAASLPDLTSAIQKFMGTSLPVGFTSKIDSLRNKTVKGTQLRRFTTITTPSSTGDTIRVHSTMEVTALKPDSVDAGDFEVPAGYNVMDTRASLADMDPAAMQQAMASAQATQAARLKNSLCGGSDTREP